MTASRVAEKAAGSLKGKKKGRKVGVIRSEAARITCRLGQQSLGWEWRGGLEMEGWIDGWIGGQVGQQIWPASAEVEGGERNMPIKKKKWGGERNRKRKERELWRNVSNAILSHNQAHV